MKIVLNRFIAYLNDSSEISPSLSISETEIKCLPCNRTFPQNPKNVVTNCIAHFKSKFHKDNCCWTLSREQGEFVTTIHKSGVQLSLNDHFKVSLNSPSNNNTTDDPSSHDTSSSCVLSSASDQSDPESDMDEIVQSTEMKSVQATVVTKNSSTQLNTASFDEQLRVFLSEYVGMKLKRDFKATDLVRSFKEYPLLKDCVQNAVRREKKSRGTTET